MSARHDPRWPDKIMAAALFVIIAGVLAVASGAMRYTSVSFNEDSSLFVHYIPAPWTIALGLLGVAAGIVAYVHQSWLMTTLGIAAGILSMGMLGASAVMASIAVWPLVRSFMEGEETRLDRHRMHSHQWPDKAIMASVVFVCAGAVALVQGMLLLTDRMATPVSADPMAWGAVSAAVGVMGIVAGRELFHLRREWMGWAAGVALVLSAALYVIGPALAVVGMVYLGLANREAEFLLHAPVKA